MAETREAKVRKAAKAAGYTLQKDGKLYRLLDGNGTVMAEDWATGAGLPLAAVEAALE